MESDERLSLAALNPGSASTNRSISLETLHNKLLQVKLIEGRRMERLGLDGILWLLKGNGMPAFTDIGFKAFAPKVLRVPNVRDIPPFVDKHGYLALSRYGALCRSLISARNYVGSFTLCETVLGI